MATYSSIVSLRIPWTEELGSYSSWSCKESDTTERLHVSPLQAYAIFSDSKELNYGVNMALITHQNPSIHRFKILLISLKIPILWNVLMNNTRYVAISFDFVSSQFLSLQSDHQNGVYRIQGVRNTIFFKKYIRIYLCTILSIPLHFSLLHTCVFVFF